MFHQQDLQVLLEKVPALRKRWKILLTGLYLVALSTVCVWFFWLVDRQGSYTPFISQLVMALVTVLLEFIHLRRARAYRNRYGNLAYQVHFYHLILPILVTWYACCFHPLFISGPPLLPTWLALSLGILLLIPVPLITVHIERAGFHTLTHGLDIFSVFPEQTSAVHGAIYGYIRHPLYLSLTCMALALALLRNNLVALLAATLVLIPALATGYLEDQELLMRYGPLHREYIRKTAALFPFKRTWAFIRMLSCMDQIFSRKDR